MSFEELWTKEDWLYGDVEEAFDCGINALEARAVYRASQVDEEIGRLDKEITRRAQQSEEEITRLRAEKAEMMALLEKWADLSLRVLQTADLVQRLKDA